MSETLFPDIRNWTGIRMKSVSRLVMLATWLAASHTAFANTNIVLNGDFENNNATAGQSQYNLTNADFSALVHDTTAYGTSGELDLYTAGSGYEPDPQSGSWELRLHGNGVDRFDAFSLWLATPVLAGASYTLQFYVAADLGMNPMAPLSVKVGLSNDGEAFGTLLYTSAGVFGTGGLWNRYDHRFVAPHAASFLTVQNVSVSAVVDNFSLSAVPEPATCAMLLAGLATLGSVARPRAQTPPTAGSPAVRQWAAARQVPRAFRSPT
ncbi:MAG: PEP-CTERM sorting domain-containing protein [Aquabacterium sp.]|nr:PEP-CTERM sorting domain-containing protein [Aquabacterium sp.]